MPAVLASRLSHREELLTFKKSKRISPRRYDYNVKIQSGIGYKINLVVGMIFSDKTNRPTLNTYFICKLEHGDSERFQKFSSHLCATTPRFLLVKGKQKIRYRVTAVTALPVDRVLKIT